MTDQATYHISSDGSAKPCSANKVSCPLGKAGAPHGSFDTPEQAQKWAEGELARKHQGSFGNLAIKLAEKTVEDKNAKYSERIENHELAEKNRLKELLQANDELFSFSTFKELANAGFLRSRSITKQWEKVAQEMGHKKEDRLGSVYGTYLKNFDYDATTVEGRDKLRDRIVTGKLISQRSDRFGGNQSLKRAISPLEDALDAVPNESKAELNDYYNDQEKLNVDELSDSELTEELALADRRSDYFKQWNGTANFRMVNYGEQQSSKQMKKLFGEKYNKIVNDGPSNGFTRKEANYFEDNQPDHWTDYHYNLGFTASERLGLEPRSSYDSE